VGANLRLVSESPLLAQARRIALGLGILYASGTRKFGHCSSRHHPGHHPGYWQASGPFWSSSITYASHANHIRKNTMSRLLCVAILRLRRHAVRPAMPWLKLRQDCTSESLKGQAHAPPSLSLPLAVSLRSLR
jgi:hypothetical protein